MVCILHPTLHAYDKDAKDPCLLDDSEKFLKNMNKPTKAPRLNRAIDKAKIGSGKCQEVHV